jgi:hypothetical protein
MSMPADTNDNQWRSQDFEVGGHHGERGARAYMGVCGLYPQAPVGSRGKAPGQGVRGLRPLNPTIF